MRGGERILSVIQCGLPHALEVVGERWSFLILRGAMGGITNFEEFRAELGIARSMLTSRLAKLVEQGILERRASSGDRRKVNYELTDKGAALLPTLLALRQWGEKWEAREQSDPVLVDKRDLKPVREVRVLAADGRPVELDELVWMARRHLEPVRGMDAGEPMIEIESG